MPNLYPKEETDYTKEEVIHAFELGQFDIANLNPAFFNDKDVMLAAISHTLTY